VPCACRDGTRHTLHAVTCWPLAPLIGAVEETWQDCPARASSHSSCEGCPEGCRRCPLLFSRATRCRVSAAQEQVREARFGLLLTNNMSLPQVDFPVRTTDIAVMNHDRTLWRNPQPPRRRPLAAHHSAAACITSAAAPVHVPITLPPHSPRWSGRPARCGRSSRPANRPCSRTAR
jgi:hypothetical protein